MPNLCDSYLLISGPPDARQELLTDLQAADLDFDWSPVEPERNERTVLSITTAYEPPEDFAASLSEPDRYPRLSFELAYVLEFTEGGGFIQFAVGKTAIHQRATGKNATLTLLDRHCPELADSQREALGESRP